MCTLGFEERDDTRGSAGASGDLHRQRQDQKSAFRQLLDIGDVLDAGNLGSAKDLVRREVARGAVI